MATFTVNQAIWIAAAALAFEKHEKDPSAVWLDYYFRQADIIKRAQLYTNVKVDSARASWWCCADNEKASNNYLRGDHPTDHTLRRLTRFDEFAEKTHPTDLNLNVEIEINGTNRQLEELFFFVEYQYPEVFEMATNIDYIGVLKFLQENQGAEYSSPDKASGAEKDRLLRLKEKGQAAVAEMKKIAALCADKFNLAKCLPIAWLDGSNTKLRNYLWAQMKYKDYAEDPSSISLFVQFNAEGKAEYRVSLEVKNDGTDKKSIAKYHTHLDLTLDKTAGLTYAIGNNEMDNLTDSDEDQYTIRNKVKSGEYKKVQLCGYVHQNDNQTNQYFESEILKLVTSLIPYYEHVIGFQPPILQKPSTNEYWPTLSEYDPGMTKDKWLQALKLQRISSQDNLFLLKCMLELGGESTCTALAEKYGNTANFYNRLGSAYGQKISTYFHIEPCDDNGQKRFFAIPFLGRYVQENGNRRYSWKLRDELKEALEEMDLSGIKLPEEDPYTIKYDKNMILYGPPGTGKTYNTAIYAVAICRGRTIEDVSSEPYSHIMDAYNRLKEEGRIAFTTFHQSYGYEEFIEGIKPVVDKDSSELGYTIEDGVFKKFCENTKLIVPTKKTLEEMWQKFVQQATEDVSMILPSLEHPETPYTVEIEDETEYKVACLSGMTCDHIAITFWDFCRFIYEGYYFYATTEAQDWIRMDASNSIYCWMVNNLRLTPIDMEYDNNPRVFIIDEINRGNISKIFGELITLIEDTKRAGRDEAASAILPYSGEEFSVPQNVYILGTMNTADRSIALMDTALRRRFQFIEMMPSSDVLRAIGADKVEDLDVANMLDVINERITFLYDREHTIGHAFFTKLAETPTVDCLGSIFEKSVIPLLQEYFYEDYQKIQLVLGDNGKTDDSHKFILDEEVKVKSIFKGNAEDLVDLPEKKYTINAAAFGNIDSYKEIM